MAQTLQHKQDLRILRAEARNILDEILIPLERKLADMHEDNRDGAPARYITAMTKTQTLMAAGLRETSARIMARIDDDD